MCRTHEQGFRCKLTYCPRCVLTSAMATSPAPILTSRSRLSSEQMAGQLVDSLRNERMLPRGRVDLRAHARHTRAHAGL